MLLKWRICSGIENAKHVLESISLSSNQALVIVSACRWGSGETLWLLLLYSHTARPLTCQHAYVMHGYANES